MITAGRAAAELITMEAAADQAHHQANPQLLINQARVPAPRALAAADSSALEDRPHESNFAI